MRLLLDFVPNHTACDHDFVGLHPEYYVMATGEVAPNETFLARDGTRLHHGRDPYFPPWTDTAQVDPRPVARQAVMSRCTRGAKHRSTTAAAWASVRARRSISMPAS